MSKIKTSARRFLFKLKHEYLIADNIILFAAVALSALFTFYSVTAMSRNWELANRVTTADRNRTLLKLEVETMELENEYYKSKEYQELAARHFQNKKLEGENMVYLPSNSDYAKNKHNNNTTVAQQTPSNFAQWMRFLFGI
ncbi:hypothetical protein IJI94_01130 [Candidatus Saccharibacteria bacterium]|nr:hypothetical protein [Candidatus Saccharibacteria bacterium]